MQETLERFQDGDLNSIAPEDRLRVLAGYYWMFDSAVTAADDPAVAATMLGVPESKVASLKEVFAKHGSGGTCKDVEKRLSKLTPKEQAVLFLRLATLATVKKKDETPRFTMSDDEATVMLDEGQTFTVEKQGDTWFLRVPGSPCK